MAVNGEIRQRTVGDSRTGRRKRENLVSDVKDLIKEKMKL
jgi:hypothetical protein